jgi:hypothetical protein
MKLVRGVVALPFLVAPSLHPNQEPIQDLLLRSRPTIAVPEFRCSCSAQASMDTFNRTLAADLARAGLFRLTPRTAFPLNVPQRPEDLRRHGFRLSDWSAQPANSKYLVIGYTAIAGKTLVLYAWMFDATEKDAEAARILGTVYRQPLGDMAGERLAHSLAADIVRTAAGGPKEVPNGRR